MKFYVIDSVADAVIVEEQDNPDVLIDPDRQHDVQIVQIGGTSIRFFDQGGGRYLGIAYGGYDAVAKEIAHSFLRVLTAAGRV